MPRKNTADFMMEESHRYVEVDSPGVDKDDRIAKSGDSSINNDLDDNDVSVSRESPAFMDMDSASTPNVRGISDASRNYNGAVRRLLAKPRNTDSVKKDEDSSVSIGERLRHGEFINDDNAKLRLIESNDKTT